MLQPLPQVSESRQPAQIAAVLFAALFPTLGTWLYFDVFAGSPGMKPAYGVTKVIQFAFPLIWVLLVMRQRVSLMKPNSRGVGEGLLYGIVVSSFIYGVYIFTLEDSSYAAQLREPLQEKLNDFGANTPLTFLALAAFYSVIHSLLEEYYWRWFVFGKLRNMLPVWLAIVLSSLAFTSHHVLVVALYFDQWLPIVALSLGVWIGGAYWAWLYHRSGSLYGPWIGHLLVDVAIMAVGYHVFFG